MHSPAGALLRDGRQPGQLERQPRLGIRARREHRRQGVFHLAEPQRAGAVRLVPVTGGNTMRILKKQKGVSLGGLIVVLFVVVVIAALGLKILPGYMEYYKIKNAIDAIASDRTKNTSVTEVRKAFEARSTIDDISAVKASDLEITKEGNAVVISFAYR